MRIAFGFIALVTFGACSTLHDAGVGETGVEPIAASTSVLNEICRRELLEEVGANPVHVPRTTREIINGDVLVALQVANGRETIPADFEKAEAVALALNAGFHSETLAVPRRSGCAFTESEPAGELTVRLEISQPFANPYASDDEVVSFVARLSLGQQTKVWYFADARSRGSTWVVERVIRLPIDE